MIHFNLSFHSTWKTLTASLGVLLLLNLFAPSSYAQIDLTGPGSFHSQNFDGADLASTQWTQYDVNADGATNCPATGNGRWNLVSIPCQIQTPANVARGGTGKALGYEFSTPNAANDWAISPAFLLKGGSPYKFIYYFRSAGTNFPEKMKAMITTGNTPATAISGVPASAPIKDYPNIASNVYAKDSIMFTPTADGTFYIALKAESNADQFFLVVDDFSAQNLVVPANDISVTGITTTTSVTNIASYTTTTPFTITVKNTGTATQTVFNVAWDVKRGTTTVASGTQSITDILLTGGQTTFNVTADLTVGGTYVVTATSQLANDQASFNNQATLTVINPLSDLTAEGSTYTQGFAQNLTANGWTTDPTPSRWSAVNLTSNNVTNAVLFGRRNDATANDFIFTNFFRLEGGKKYRISYQRMKFNNSNPVVATNDEKMRLFIGGQATTTAMTTQLGATADETVSNTTFSTVTIEYTAPNTGIYHFGFRYLSDALPTGFPTTAAAGLMIDNFSVINLPANDMAMKRFSGTVPTACGGYTASTPIAIRAWNSGSAPVTNLTAKYRIKDATGAITTPATAISFSTFPIAVNDTITLNFNVDLSATRYHLIETYFEGDGFVTNDTIKLAFVNGYRDLSAGGSYAENFDNPNNLAWSVLNAGTTGSTGWGLGGNTTLAASGANYFFANTNTTVTSNALLFTSCTKLKAGTVYGVGFKYRTNANPEKLKVVLVNATTAAAVTAGTVLRDYTALTSNNTYTTVTPTTLAFQVPADGNYYICFQMYSDANATTGAVRIDDFVLETIAAPAAPTGLTATASTSTKKIDLSWTAVAGISTYTIERGTSGTGPFTQIGTSTSTTYADQDAALALSTAYYYQVKAAVATVAPVNPTALLSAASNVANATIVATTPAAPTALTATASTTQKQIALSWTASAGATSYSVERRTGANAFAQIATNLTGTTYTDSDAVLAFNTTYDYVVKAKNGFDLTSAASNTASASVVNIAPNAPVLNAIVNATTGLRNTLTWNAVAGAAGYRIERSTTGATGAFTQVGSTGTGANSTTYQDNNVVYQQQYHYRVFAFNDFLTSSAASNVQGVTVTSIENPALSELVQVYPNPTSESKFNVELPEIQAKTVTFVVFDAKGKEVYRAEGKDEKTFALKATGLAKGLYFVHINTSKGLAIKKVVIE